MAKPALKERELKKKKKKKDAPEASPSQIQERAKPKSIFLEALAESRINRARTVLALKENLRLNSENEQLRAENEELATYVEDRRRQARESAARKRQENLEEKRKKDRLYKAEYRARKKQEAESQDTSDT